MMQELEEAVVRVIWLKLEAQAPEETLAAMQRFRDEQTPLFQQLTMDLQACSETAQEILLYLAVTVFQVVEWRRFPKGPFKLSVVDEARVWRNAKKRGSTVGAFLVGKQARSQALAEALEILVERFELPQLPLLGHATEGLLAAYDDGDLTREEVELCFVRLLVLLDGVDQVVKS